MSEFKFPSEVIELPSKGLVYPEDNPLSSGTVEMKYMTAKEEDILTNQNYIKSGLVLDKLLQSLIISKIDYNDLIVGDKNALLVAARILGYGKDYKIKFKGEEVNIDLSTLDNKLVDESLFTKGKNEFEFTLPNSGTVITWKILTHRDEQTVDKELAALRKINKNSVPELSTRLKRIITSVNGDSETKTIRDFVDNYLLAMDSRALRKHISEFQPDINMNTKVELSNGTEEDVEVPISINFFWPDLNL